MADKYNNDISADELLAKLKANMEDGGTKSGDGKKRYRFRKIEKTASPVTEEEIKQRNAGVGTPDLSVPCRNRR